MTKTTKSKNSSASEFEAVIGLEVHAELETKSKMFCACPVVDHNLVEPNTAVCPVCSGMPGVLPVVNQRAVEYALRVALALECEIAPVSIFARKNYFYPDLPKGYQISQYEQPLAVNGRLTILTSQGERHIPVRRVHLEEDTGKLTHVEGDEERYSLIDLNRAGIPLLEIVSEPELHSAEEVRAFAVALRSLLLYLGVNTGDMQKGVLRIEPNVSVRPAGSSEFGTRTEIKNLNSFRALEKSVGYEIQRQIKLNRQGKQVVQETMGWDEAVEETIPQRSKEEAHDYRYFPEPDLPPLVIEKGWIEQIRSSLPELPFVKLRRFRKQYGLNTSEAEVLIGEPDVADYFECTANAGGDINPRSAYNWITGEMFAYMNQTGMSISGICVQPTQLADLIRLVYNGDINQNTAKSVLLEMFQTGEEPQGIVERLGLHQFSDVELIAEIVERVLAQNPELVSSYLGGKTGLAGWFFGQIMHANKGKANPQIVKSELESQLKELGNSR
ncbi:MAG: Asp-tRNA(Asn)/Glu-tRNA(Gln) amidotransferase subunit GatB [Anaerolineales bacterium]